MKFEYIGYRPIISQFGVCYKKGKNDKYVYLPYVYEILNAVSNEYDMEKNHTYTIKVDKSNISKLYNNLLGLNPKLDQEIIEKLENYKSNLEIKSNEIKDRKNFTQLEKDAYLNNLEYKKDYKINRAKNKIFYYTAVLAIANIIKHKKIKKLTIPFNGKFWHVLKTLQGVLSGEKVGTRLSITEKNGALVLIFTTSL